MNSRNPYCDIVKSDPRELESQKFVDLEGLYLVFKSTRAGATSNIMRSIAQKHKVVIVYPTLAIGAQTVAVEVNQITELLGLGRHVKVVNIPGNKECPRNQDMIKRVPLLDYMETLPLYDKCGDCELFDGCPVVQVLDGDYDIITLSYPKLSALVAAAYFKKGTAWLILQELMNCKVFVLDEAHVLELGTKADIELYNTRDGYSPMFSPSASLSDCDTLLGVMDAYRTLYSSRSVRDALDVVVEKLTSRKWNEKYTRVVIGNPLLSYAGADMSKKMERYVKATREIMSIGRHLSESLQSDEVSLETKYSFVSVLELYKVLTVCSSKNLFLNVINDKGVLRVFISANDNSVPDNIQTFVNWMLQSTHTHVTFKNSVTFDPGYDELTAVHSSSIPGMIDNVTQIETDMRKLVILTSATFGQFKNGFLKGLTKPAKSSLFGNGGDPMKTNEKMFVFADKYSLGSIGRNSRYNKKEVIFQQCKDILDQYGISNCKILTMNIEQYEVFKAMFENAGYLGVDITYYNATDTIGVSSDKRVLIALGKADKPSTVYDVFAGGEVESKEIRLMRTHQDTWQAWSRAKDPQGKAQSFVFALGVPYWECCNIVTWGADREVVLTEGKRRYEVQVNEDMKVSVPNVLETSGFKDMLDKAKSISCAETCTAGEPLRSYSNLPYTEEILKDPLALMWAVTSRTDVTAEQFQGGRGYKPRQNICNDAFFKFHLNHSITLGTYILDNEDKTTFGVIDIDCHKEGEEVIAEAKAEALDKFLIDNGLDARKEETGYHSYHYWFLFDRCSGSAAMNFLRGITREIGFPETEVFPPSPTRGDKGKGNLVRYPFGRHQFKNTISKVLVNGEYVRDFENLTVRRYDISSFEADENPSEVPTEQAEPIKSGAFKSPLTCPASEEFNSSVEFSSGSHDDSYIRPCMEMNPETQFVHVRSHYWVKSMVFEYLKAGYTPVEIQEMFVNQKGYDAKKTAYNIADAATGLKKSATCRKIKDWVKASEGCGISCAGCNHKRKWRSVQELKASRCGGDNKSSPLCPVSVSPKLSTEVLNVLIKFGVSGSLCNSLECSDGIA